MKMHKLVSSALLSMILLGAGASLPQSNVSAHRVNHNRPVKVVKKQNHRKHLNKQHKINKRHVKKAAKKQNQPKLTKNQAKKQAKKQNQGKLIKNVKKAAKKDHNHNWFNDGLNKRQLKARAWVAWHESRDNWNILSYGHVCVGYFQLNPHYLGYKHGHVNLDHAHQVKVADHYAKTRYGSWTNAKRFWQAHNWY